MYIYTQHVCTYTYIYILRTRATTHRTNSYMIETLLVCLTMFGYMYGTCTVLFVQLAQIRNKQTRLTSGTKR